MLLLTSLLLEFLEESSEDRSPLWWGYLMAISLFVVSLTEAFTSIHSINIGLNLGQRVSATLMSALFDKVLLYRIPQTDNTPCNMS